MSQKKVFVVGVGMTKIEKPGTRKWDYPEIGHEAALAALQDAGVPYDTVESVVASYCYGEPTCGQTVAYQLGLTGVPVFNVNNNCSSGSSALMLARKLIISGHDCVLAVGFEKMERGLSERYPDKVSPVKKHFDHLEALGAKPGLVRDNLNSMTSEVIKLFAYAAREYMAKHPNTKFEDFVKIAYKNHKHGSNNPRACFQKTVPMTSIAEKGMLCYPITFLMSTPTADGGAAAVVCSEDFVNQHGLHNHAVEIVGQNMVTDMTSSFESSVMPLAGYDMAKKAATMCYEESGLTPQSVDVAEVHDCFSCNELFMYEALGFAEEGEASLLLNNGRWVKNKNGSELYQLGGRWVVNPSGGLESKGHPIGATGLGQCAELVWQLRGEADKRQVDGAQVGIQHNFGIGGACVVTLYRKWKPDRQSKL